MTDLTNFNDDIKSLIIKRLNKDCTIWHHEALNFPKEHFFYMGNSILNYKEGSIYHIKNIPTKDADFSLLSDFVYSNKPILLDNIKEIYFFHHKISGIIDDIDEEMDKRNIAFFNSIYQKYLFDFNFKNSTSKKPIQL